MNSHSRHNGNSLIIGASTLFDLVAVRPLFSNLLGVLFPDTTPK